MHVNEITGKLRRKIHQTLVSIREEWRYPYLRIKELPENAPSLESIYYYINQLGKHKPEGLTHNTSVGYHELPFPELKFKVSRNDLKVRVDRILRALDVKGKYGVDFGCAVGGVTFSLQLAGAKMAGIDRDRPSLRAAEECEAYFKSGARFVHGGISQSLCESLLKEHHNTEGKWDFVVWLSSFNWISKAIGPEGTAQFLKFLSQNCQYLIMDSAIGGKGQEALSELKIEDNAGFKKYILDHSDYSTCETIGVDSEWYGREVYKFTKS